MRTIKPMKKILIVDDDPEILSVVKNILISHGFEVLTDSTCLHVEDIVKSFRPDLILLDVRLPGKQGDEICKELKEIHSIPILLFSANSREQIIRECKADGFIAKPFDLRDFVEMIQFHLN